MNKNKVGPSEDTPDVALLAPPGGGPDIELSDAVLKKEVETTDKTAQPPPPFPKTCGARVGWIVRAVIVSIISSITYIIFLFAVFAQSSAKRKPVNTEKWQSELGRNAWIVALIVAVLLFVYPFIAALVLIPRLVNGNPSNAWAMAMDQPPPGLPPPTISASYVSITIPFFAVLFLIHLLTVDYACLRPDLASVRRTITPAWRGRLPRATINNVITLVNVPFEFFQLFLPVIRAVPMTYLSAALGTHGLEIFGSGGYTSSSFLTIGTATWIVAIGLCVLYAALIGITIFMNWDGDHVLGPLIYSILPGTLYITIVSNLMKILRCGASPDPSVMVPVLTADAAVVCWTSSHNGMILGSLLGLFFFSASAMFVAVYRGHKKVNVDLKFQPRFVVIERTIKDVFVLVVTLSPNVPVLIAFTGLTALVIMLFLLVLHPWSWRAVGVARVLLLSMVLFATVVAAVIYAGILPDPFAASIAVLALSGIALVGSALCVSVFARYLAPPHLGDSEIDEEEEDFTPEMGHVQEEADLDASRLALERRRASVMTSSPVASPVTSPVTSPVKELPPTFEAKPELARQPTSKSSLTISPDLPQQTASSDPAASSRNMGTDAPQKRAASRDTLGQQQPAKGSDAPAPKDSKPTELARQRSIAKSAELSRQRSTKSDLRGSHE